MKELMHILHTAVSVLKGDSCLHPERRQLLFNDFLKKTTDRQQTPPGLRRVVIKMGFHGFGGGGYQEGRLFC